MATNIKASAARVIWYLPATNDSKDHTGKFPRVFQFFPVRLSADRDA
jgi:hypothetical protein